MHDLEMQQYLFDIQGYLVVEDALSAGEVAALNQLIDAQGLPPPAESTRFGSAPTLGSSLVKAEPGVPEGEARVDQSAPVGAGFLDWGQPFCDLLDHAAIMPLLRMRLGDAFRLDRLYGMNMTKGMSYGGLHADYGATAPKANVGRVNIMLSAPIRFTKVSSLSPGRYPMAAANLAASAAFQAATRAITPCPNKFDMSTICRRR